jgi:hypothetical protein
MKPFASIELSTLNLQPSGEGILNDDGSECPPEARLSAPLCIGPFCLHFEAYEVIEVEGEGVRAKYDAFAEEVEACFAANEGYCPEYQEINGHLYVMRAFPFAE